MYKVHLHNLRATLTRAGYGEGATHQDAVDAALSQAREQDPGAWFDQGSGMVHFRGFVRL